MKLKVFIDTNIMLDLLSEREPFYTSAAKIASLADTGKIELYVSALSFATSSYILSKFEKSIENVRNKLRMFKVISNVCSINETTIEKSLNSDFTDFEDALQHFSALENNCQLIITRNSKDFSTSLIPIMTPDEFLKTIEK